MGKQALIVQGKKAKVVIKVSAEIKITRGIDGNGIIRKRILIIIISGNSDIYGRIGERVKGKGIVIWEKNYSIRRIRSRRSLDYIKKREKREKKLRKELPKNEKDI